MLKSRKFQFIIALSISLVFLVAGCSGSASNKANPTPTVADNYPSRPVELVVPFGPGGSHDLHSRAIASVINKYIGQPMTVVLKEGASGALGSDYVAKSKADGYTVLFGGSGPNTSLLWVQQLPYKRDDFVPICLINYSPSIILVNADSPFKTLKDLLDYSKKNPDKLKYSSSGVYGATHIPVAMLLDKAGVSAVHVPFNGGGPALTALLGKQVDFTATQTTQARPFVDSGKVRALGISGTERDKGNLKEVPTFKELGYDAVYQMGRFVLVPKGTPEPVVTKLRDSFKQLVQDPTFKSLVTNLGEEINYLDGPDFQKWWDNEYKTQEATLKNLVANTKK